MANAVILILVIGYCLFLIYKQVQNRKAGKHLGCTCLSLITHLTLPTIYSV